MKKIISLTACCLFSLSTYASLDCEDVVSMSTDSSALSREVSQINRTESGQAHNEQILSVSKKVVGELGESMDIPAANPSDDELKVLDDAKKVLADSELNESKKATAIKKFDNELLHTVNSLRVKMMNNIRQAYEHCFKSK